MRLAGVDANAMTRALHGRPGCVAVRTLRLITTELVARPTLRLAPELLAKPV
jgi:hypothetical protein